MAKGVCYLQTSPTNSFRIILCWTSYLATVLQQIRASYDICGAKNKTKP